MADDAPGGLTAATRDNTQYETDAERDGDSGQRIALDQGMGIVECIHGHILRAAVLLAGYTTDVSSEITNFFANRFGGFGGLAPSGGTGGSFISFVRSRHLAVLLIVGVSAGEFRNRLTANVSVSAWFPSGHLGANG
jgi:hypothetical protein